MQLAQKALELKGANETVEEPENTEEEVIEEDTSEKIEVNVKFTSVEKDIKIKFIDNAAGKLVTGKEFKVKLTDKKGKETSLTDTDKDGIIYQTGLEGGKYQVSIEEMENISFNASQEVEIKGSIEYKKVEIVEEIKKESEIKG